MNLEKPHFENDEEECEDDKEREEPSITISTETTFADLFRMIEEHEKSEELADLFEEELNDNFGPEILDEVLTFEEPTNTEAAKTKVVDFFVKHGYKKDDILAYLPIKFT